MLEMPTNYFVLKVLATVQNNFKTKAEYYKALLSHLITTKQYKRS